MICPPIKRFDLKKFLSLPALIRIATDAKMSSTSYRKIVVTPEKFGSRDFAEATKIVEVELPSIPPGIVPQFILVKYTF